MAVKVVSNIDTDVYETGTKWVIDDERQLHVVGGNGNLASYAEGQWMSAHHLDMEEIPNAA